MVPLTTAKYGGEQSVINFELNYRTEGGRAENAFNGGGNQAKPEVGREGNGQLSGSSLQKAITQSHGSCNGGTVNHIYAMVPPNYHVGQGRVRSDHAGGVRVENPFNRVGGNKPEEGQVYGSCKRHIHIIPSHTPYTTCGSILTGGPTCIGTV